MSENLPNLPTGAIPPKPAEAAKVQPKKETVRINLPPKPTTSPTIKLPSLAAAAPATPAPPAAYAPAAASPHVAVAAPAAAHRPSSAAAAPRAAAPAAPRPVSAASVSVVDKILALVAALIGLAVLVQVFMLGNN